MTAPVLTPPRTGPPVTARAALRFPGLRRLLLAHLTGKLAQHLLVLAAGLQTVQQTSSGGWASVVVALGYAPQALLSGYAGALADRRSRSAVLAWSGWVRAGAGAAALLAVALDGPLPLLVAAVAVAAVAATPGYPAAAAGAQQCVPPSAVPMANSLVTAVENAGWTAGPGLFGLIVLAGGGPFTALVAGTALLGVGAVVASLVRLPAPDGAHAPSGGLRGAARVVLRSRALGGPLVLASGGNLLYGYLVVLLVLLGTGPGADPDAVGRLNTALAAGAVLTLLVVGRLARLRRPARVLRWSMVGFAACVGLLAVVRAPLPAVLLVAAAGAGTLVVEMVAVTLLARAAPGAARARVFGIYDQLAGLAIALGSLLAGPLVDALGAGPATALTATVVLLPLATPRRRP